ncbi:MAG: GNAT family N-acetyltransferase [Pseudomonadota bacterium]
MRTCWEEWQNHPNNDFDHFQLVCYLRDEVLGPHVIVVERDGRPCALLAARLELTHFVPAIGYFKPIRIPVTVLTVIHEGLLGQVDEEIGEELVRHVKSFLSSGAADAAVFHHLPQDSPLLKALLIHKPQSLTEKKPICSTHWSMEISEEQGFLLKNLKSKHRSWIRGREKKLNSAFQGKVSWQWMNQIDDLPNLCSQLEEVAAHTYQRGLGSGFINNEEHRQRFSLFANRGQLRVQVLKIDGKIRAFWIGTVYRGVFHSSETGYDSDLRNYEPGTLIFLRMVDALANEGIKKLDFGLGDAYYKQRFGDRSWQQATIRLFATSIKGLALKTTMGLFGTLDSTARSLLQKSGLVDRVKTGWRRRVASRKTVNDDK